MNSEERIDDLPLRVSPLAERLGKDEYFTGAGHLNILVNIRKDIAARVALLVLTGEEGVGKSVLARMAAAESRPGCITVLCDQPVDSFDDLVSTIVDKVGVEVPDEGRDRIAGATELIAAGLAHRNERLLLICDGAERIFLATLERLRKMMDRLNRTVISMQVVLVGRPLLLDNLRQLSICDFQEIEERRYVLEPLTFAETRSYFEFCKKQMADDESAVFTGELIEQIYQQSHGNFSEIHLLAEQLCKRYNKDASFWVLLENVEGGQPRVSRQPRLARESRLSRFDFRRLGKRQQYLAGGVIAAVLLLLMIFTVTGKKAPEPIDVKPGQQEAIQQEQPAAAPEQPVPPAPLPVVPEQVASSAPPEPALDPPPEEPLETENAAAGPAGAGEPLPVKAVGEQQADVEKPIQPPQVAGGVPGDAAADLSASEQTMQDDPARMQLKQAEALLSEAQQAVAAAKTGRGEELKAEVALPQSSADQAHLQGDEPKAQIVLSPAKTLAQGTPPGPEKEKTVILHPEQIKKIMPGSQPASTAGSAAAAAVDRDRSDQMDTAGGGAAPRILVDRAKVKKLQGNDSGTGVARQTLLVKGSGQAGKSAAAGTAPESGSPWDGDSKSKSAPVLHKAIVSGESGAVGSGVYPSRVAAGVPWLDGRRNGKYTLQLMVLSSATARENIREMLVEKEYARQADNLYIFEKRGSTPSVFVFMGEYNTLAEAQAAKDRMPEALRRHQPYALSVQEAMGKVK